MLLALLGADETLVARVLELLPAEQAESLRQRMEHPGPTRLSDVEQAQHELAQLASRIVASRGGKPERRQAAERGGVNRKDGR